MKTVYCLRIRVDNASPWGEVEYFLSKKQRNHSERTVRCLLGGRTHSYDEEMTPAQIKELAIS